MTSACISAHARHGAGADRGEHGSPLRRIHSAGGIISDAGHEVARRHHGIVLIHRRGADPPTIAANESGAFAYGRAVPSAHGGPSWSMGSGHKPAGAGLPSLAMPAFDTARSVIFCGLTDRMGRPAESRARMSLRSVRPVIEAPGLRAHIARPGFAHGIAYGFLPGRRSTLGFVFAHDVAAGLPDKYTPPRRAIATVNHKSRKPAHADPRICPAVVTCGSFNVNNTP